MAKIFVYVNPDSLGELDRRGVLNLEMDRYSRLVKKADFHFIVFGDRDVGNENMTVLKTHSKFLFYLSLPFLLFRHRDAKLFRSYRQFYCALITGVMAKLMGKKFVTSVHGEYERFEKLRHGSVPLTKRLAEKIVLALADGFVVSSYSLRDYLSKKTDKLVFVNPASQPGIDPQKFLPSNTKREPVVLFVGRISPEKNVPVLYSAFDKLSKKHPKLTLQLVVSRMTEVENKFLSQLHGGKNIEIHENVPNDDMPSLYRRASVLVLPSVTEGCPHVLLEAIACGCPVVATDVGDNSVIVNEGKSGFLVPVGDAEALASAIQKALGLEVPAPESERIRKTYSIDRSIEKEIEFLESAI